MGNIFYLKQSVASFSPESVESSKLNGQIKGIAYSGGVIKNHGPFENLIIDLATTKVMKSKTPLFRDHNPSQIVGHGSLNIDKNQVSIDGKLSTKSAHGKEILDLAEDGFDWEMSIGIFDFDIQEVSDETVNGIKLENGIVFRNGVIREVSLVSLGADMNTNAEVFNFKRGEKMDEIKLSLEQREKLACACGGNKDSKPEELAESAEDKVKELEGIIKDLQAKLDKIEQEKQEEKDKEEMAARQNSIEVALEAKKVTFSVEKIAESSKSVEATDLLLGLIEGMATPVAPTKVISEKFTKKVDLNDGLTAKENLSADDINQRAELLVKEGKAANLMEAILMVEEK